MKKHSWKIAESARDWECDWDGDELFHLRHFREFSLPEKLRAIESMQEVSDFLSQKAKKRRTSPRKK